MLDREKILFKGKTKLDKYQVIDMVYEGRKARVLFSGDKIAAFSGMPLDGEHTLLFDYIQRFFELVSHIRPKKLLVVGGGVYTLPTALIHSLPDIVIDVVEIDAGLDAIAEAFFGFTPHERIDIVHADGKDFLSMNDKAYDMVIVDAFTHLNIPESLSGAPMAKLIHDHLNPDGIVAINIISALKGRNAQKIENFYRIYSSLFEQTGIYPADGGISPWAPQNFLLVGKKGDSPASYGLRFESIKLISDR